jgi:hypothetical protein
MFASLKAKLSSPALPILAALALLASTAAAADFTNYPVNTEAYYDGLYNDSWSARSAMCTPGDSRVECSGGNCDVTIGRVYARFEGPDFDTAMEVCWVSKYDAFRDIKHVIC